MLTYEDVTDRLTLERHYNTLIEVQRRTLDNLYEGVALIGPDGRLKLCNAAFRRLWQYDEADLQGEPHVSALVEKSRRFYDDTIDWPEQRKMLMTRLTAREPVSGVFERQDGTTLEYAGVPLPDGMTLMTYVDVSDRSRVERALRERNEALQEADRLKSEFVANVSYELRTPLNTIIGFAEVLSGDMFGRLNEKQADYIAGILQSSETLLELINDILDLATIEAGYMKLDPHAFDVHAMMAGVYAMNRERARQASQKLEFDCASDIGTVVADERRLKQVLFNLVSNAITFTPQGGSIRRRRRVRPATSCSASATPESAFRPRSTTACSRSSSAAAGRVSARAASAPALASASSRASSSCMAARCGSNRHRTPGQPSSAASRRRPSTTHRSTKRPSRPWP